MPWHETDSFWEPVSGYWCPSNVTQRHVLLPAISSVDQQGYGCDGCQSGVAIERAYLELPRFIIMELQVFMDVKGGVVLADLLSKKDALRVFPNSKSSLGPIKREGVRIYGRDLTAPLSPSVIAAAAHLFRTPAENMDKAVYGQMWANLPTLADEDKGTVGSALQHFWVLF